MSDTPRTDALIAEMEATKQDIWQALNGLQGFARRLERELAQANEALMMKAQQCSAERQRANAAERDLAKERCLPATSKDVHDTLIDAERYRWLRECPADQRVTIAEYATEGYLLDHHVDKGRCGL